LPENIVHDENLFIPFEMQSGKYMIEIVIVSPVSYESLIKLAIERRNNEGWYPTGEIKIRENEYILRIKKIELSDLGICIFFNKANKDSEIIKSN
jgi:hypothetical protein